jgi:hypothetical protein
MHKLSASSPIWSNSPCMRDTGIVFGEKMDKEEDHLTRVYGWYTTDQLSLDSAYPSKLYPRIPKWPKALTSAPPFSNKENYRGRNSCYPTVTHGRRFACRKVECTTSRLLPWANLMGSILEALSLCQSHRPSARGMLAQPANRAG